MTNLKSANIGFNKYCAPAVLSILTGKTTDECAKVISKINGQYIVTGVQLNHLLLAADRMGFDNVSVGSSGTLYKTLVTISKSDGMYIVTVPNHFVVIEVRDKQIYFCDNHTKEPIPASSSARLMQSVVACHRVSKRDSYVEPELPKLLESHIEVTDFQDADGYHITIKRREKYNYSDLDKVVQLAYLNLSRDELKYLINELVIIKELPGDLDG